MSNIENVNEAINAEVDAVTVDIPVRVTMTSINNAPFEFTTSIDEVGQIVLTPTTKDVEFTVAETATTTEDGEELLQRETTTNVENDSSGYSFTTRETTIHIQGNMLAESDNHDVSAFVDDIGQVILTPADQNSTFVSAVIGDSLNIVTEDVDVTKADSVEQVSQEEATPKISAEVVDESCDEFSEERVVNEIEQLTNSYTDEQGTLSIDNICEASICAKLLKSHYDITIDLDTSVILISYVKKQELSESMSADARQNLINKFMRGEIALFSDTGVPLESYIPLNELNSNGYNYYYDPESDAIVSYPSRTEQ